jgi:hypothetical protein
VVFFNRSYFTGNKLNEEVADILESNLILLAPHVKSGKFLSFMEKIFNCCEAYNADPELFRTIYDIYDNEFRRLLKKLIFNYKSFLRNNSVIVLKK